MLQLGPSECIGEGKGETKDAAGSVLARASAGTPSKALDGYIRALVPAMCLNRYYVAEGVRVYSQVSPSLVRRFRNGFRTGASAPVVLHIDLEAVPA